MKGHSESILQGQLSVIDTGEPLAPEFELFNEGDELYAAMARSIQAATQRVFLASYILAADEVGTVLLDELMRHPGVALMCASTSTPWAQVVAFRDVIDACSGPPG